METEKKLKIVPMDQEQFNLAQRTIFLETEKPKSSWLRKKVIRYLQETTPEMKRYLRIHHWAKRKIFQRGIKIFRFVLKKYIIKSDAQIPQYWNNNHIRIFYNSFVFGLEDAFKYMVWNMANNKFREKYKGDTDKYIKWIKNKGHWSYQNRRDFIGIWTCEILEDTFDREWLNMAMMRMAHRMMEHYGVSELERLKVPQPGQYPVYLSPNQNNPNYWMKNNHLPVWNHNELVKEENYYGAKSKDKKSSKGNKKKQRMEKGKSSKSNGKGSTRRDKKEKA